MSDGSLVMVNESDVSQADGASVDGSQVMVNQSDGSLVMVNESDGLPGDGE